MALLDVIHYGHPTLRKIAEPYEKDEIDPDFIRDMLDTMHTKDGVGLAAPQVNVSKRLIMCYDGENEYVFINPTILAHSEAENVDDEGCLSLPGLEASVSRYQKVIVRARDADWNKVNITARGLLSVILQHEIDHINGVLYIDRADISALKWTEAEIVPEQWRQQKTTLEEAQRFFKNKFHGKGQELVFEPVSEKVA